MCALTFGIGVGAIAPYIAILPGTTPLMVAAGLATFVWLTTYFLPEPGHHLPKAKVNKEGKLEVDVMAPDLNETTREVHASFAAPAQGFSLHQMSYTETGADVKYGVMRPGLIEASGPTAFKATIANWNSAASSVNSQKLAEKWANPDQA